MAVMALAFAVGFMVCAWLVTLGGGSYVMYRYVYLPWKVMRRDLMALDAKMNEIVAALREVKETALRNATLMSDEEQAVVERRLRMRSDARAAAHR